MTTREKIACIATLALAMWIIVAVSALGGAAARCGVG